MVSPSSNDAPVVSDDARYQQWIQRRPDRTVRILRVLTEWWWDHIYRLEAHHVERVPAEGAFVLVPNHSSYTDPFLHARPLPRTVRFMAKSTLFRNPLMRRVIESGGGFPVRRGEGDTFAMELARRLLLAGEPVVMYPEGTRFRDSLELGPSKRGAARLALETHVPIVPAATWGVKARELYGRPRWRRPRATVVYGAPLDFTHLEPTPANVEMVRDEIWRQVQELYAEARERAQQRA